jgi:Zinc knuckle
MEIDAKISRVKDLISKRENIDAELAVLLGVSAGQRKAQKCTSCGEEGHTARTCTKESKAADTSST